MSEKNEVDTKLVDKAKALGQAARSVGASNTQEVSRGNLGTNINATHTPNAKQENQSGGSGGDQKDAKHRSLPKEQAENRNQQSQQQPNERGGRGGR